MAQRYNKSPRRPQEHTRRDGQDIRRSPAVEPISASAEDFQDEVDLEAASGAEGWSPPPIDEDIYLRWLAKRLDCTRLAALDFIAASPPRDGRIHIVCPDGTVQQVRPPEVFGNWNRTGHIHYLLLEAAQLYARERPRERGTARIVQCALTAWEFCLDDLKRKEASVSGRVS
jgi:hypothetical protein